MTGEEKRAAVEGLLEENPGALFADGFDDAIVGIATQFSRPALVVYDRRAMVDQLVRDGADPDEASEYISFNVEGAWVGDGTPLILSVLE